ncbi:MAG: epoxide hydrolase N-terminal domain-containing protein [Chloroflexi bacterium]|nr:epoxide hydrolase N-terminal domain-containing protein [Chloroflexota bacterium]MDA1239757.1 epoxide hydrolase N-terminal domain-containing protein [Chloroflexota bacterium]MQC47672.1 hypothetical protein [Chloroflexota bacterium]
MNQLRPFRIEFTDRAIADLRERLNGARWPSPLPGQADFDATLRLLARDWARFDWAPWQARLNALAHLRGVVEGGEVHAAVLAGPWGEQRPALLLLPAAAGAFFDRLDLAERLTRTDGGAPAFDVVLASLPGTGYSERLEGTPTPAATARRLHAYMGALGYGRFQVQGDGYGAVVAATLVEASGGAVTSRSGGMEAAGAALPPSQAYALLDSPVGMLAWWLAERGAPPEAEREACLASATWCWLTGSAVVASGLGRG